MPSPLAERELLFEAMTIHLGYAPRRLVEEARKSLVDAGERTGASSLAQVLVEREIVSADRARVLNLLVDDYLAGHQGNLRQCLDGLSAFGKLRRDLEGRLTGLESHHPTRVPSNGKRGRPEAPAQPAGPPPDSPPPAPQPGRDDKPDDEEDDEEADSEYAWILSSPGSTASRYEILHAHARGGIGVVWLAFDSELQREVALKQIKTESADDPESRARFLLEAEVTGRLEHPGIVPVYGLGADGHGRPYYAMRFVRGITLDEAISKYHKSATDQNHDANTQALELRQLLSRFVNVCHTMAYAHSRGVLHRDLKPANVLLGAYNETLIVDWGLAKVLGRGRKDPSQPPAEEPKPSPADEPKPSRAHRGPGRIIPPLGHSSSTDTVAGLAFGTPAFMSPEQAEGLIDRLGPPSDLYSLGAMLYTLLCGRPPFESAWCEMTVLLAQVRNGKFTPPRQVNPSVPRPLEAVCLKAMANRPEDRYADAEALADDIERWMADEPVAAYQEPRWARILRWGRRHRPLVAGAAGLLATALVGLTLGILLLGRAQRETEFQRRRAVEQSETATRMSLEANNQAEALRRRDYINRVNLAHREFEDDNATLAEQILEGCPPVQRHWEWWHVQRLAHLELATYPNTSGSQQYDVWSVAFSADGKRMASGSGPWFQAHAAPTAGLMVRDVKSGREIFSRYGEPGAVQAVAISPDGRHVLAATGTTDDVTKGVLTCHDAVTGAVHWRMEEPNVNILSLAYAPDGKTIACGCGGFNNYNGIGYVRLRDAANGKDTGRLAGGPGGVVCVAYSPDGTQLALANRGLVDVWDIARRAVVHSLRGHLEFVYAVTFSPDGKYIASGGWDRVVRLWDRKTGQPVRTMPGHRGFVRGLTFRPDGRQLVSCSEDRSLRLWDVASGQEVASFNGHMGFVHCAAFHPDGARVASGSMDGTVKLWPAAAPDPQVVFRNGSGWVGTVAFHPDCTRVATAHNGGIRVWDPATGEELWRASGPRGLLGRIALAFSRDGTQLLASGPGSVIHLWDASTGTLLRDLAHTPSPAVDLALSPDGKLAGAACEDGTIRLWNVGQGTAPDERVLTGHSGTVNALAFSPDARLIVSAGEDQKLKLWDLATGKERAILEGHVTGIKDVAFSPDGRHLASVGGQYRGTPAAECFLWEWDGTVGRVIQKLAGHTGLVSAVAYFPDGRRLATASDDRSIKIWDPYTGEDVFTLRGHTSGVVSLAVSSDAGQIVSGSIDCTARVWSAQPPSVAIDQVRRRAAVNLVQLLFETRMLKGDVLAALRADRAIDASLRDAAIQVAERRTEDAQALYESAWLTIVRPTAAAAEYDQALRRLEASCTLAAADPDRLAEYQHVMALALYRTGRHAEALQLVDRLTRAGKAAGGQSRVLPVDLAVMALANQKLGHAVAARAALDRLQSLINAGPGTDEEALGYLREVAAEVHE